MFAKPIDIGPIDEGLDRKNLTTLKKRFLQINNARLDRVYDVITDRQRPYLQLIPLLFHVNHPMLPGYVSHQTPCGIDNYEPDAEALRIAKKFSRSFRYQNASQRYDNRSQCSAIEAIFLMGSIGTIAHTRKSDLDCWICHSNIDATSLKELRIKAQLITNWANNAGLDVHFFIMNAEEFRAGKNLPISAEASGNTQHYLLLDEFYRSSILLAGRRPLWWFVPSNAETNYADYTRTLLGKRFLASSDVIDLGGVGHIPASEFISAGLWHLYKAIDSPYKSLFKLILLETYASELPNIRPLSLDYKQSVYDGCQDLNLLDPYVLTFHRVKAYLLQRREDSRLSLAKRCFYFKAQKKLSSPSTKHLKSWQRDVIQSFVADWQWSEEQLAHLDNPSKWNIAEALKEHQAIVLELNRSYQCLTTVEDSDLSHTQYDANEFEILGNKLKANFTRRQGKIIGIRLGFDLQVAEDHLVFHETHDDAGRHIWQLHLQELRDFNTLPKPAVYTGQSLCELIVWALRNAVLHTQTHVELVTERNSASATAASQCAKALVDLIPLPTEKTPHDNFSQSPVVTDIVIIVNLESEITTNSSSGYVQRISERTDAFNFGTNNENLAQSIDIVMRNSWDEIEIHHFSDNALIHALSFYLQKLADCNAKSQLRPKLQSYCFTTGFGLSIKNRVHGLFLDAATSQIFESTRFDGRYVFSADNCFYCCERTHSHHVRQFTSEPELLDYLSQPLSGFHRLRTDSFLDTHFPLHLLASVCQKPSIHIVFSIRGKNANALILDESGSLFVADSVIETPESYLRCLHYFIRDYIQQQNLPVLSPDSFGVFPVEFHQYDFNDFGHEFLKPAYVTTDIYAIPCHTVIAEVHQDHDDQLWFTLHINNEVFDGDKSGSRLFSSARQTILQHDGNHPFYVTHLDVTHCPRLKSRQGGDIQLVHYLTLKQHIEERLNAGENR
ncbi:class I adenylate cyclase [Aurantivibrio plasticivorans]